MNLMSRFVSNRIFEDLVKSHFWSTFKFKVWRRKDDRYLQELYTCFERVSLKLIHLLLEVKPVPVKEVFRGAFNLKDEETWRVVWWEFWSTLVESANVFGWCGLDLRTSFPTARTRAKSI